MSRWVRLLISAACALVPILLAAPSSASAASNCCFEFAMGGGQTASLDYGTELPQPYHGEYALTRTYSVRSIVAFHESAITHRASLVEKNSEAVIRTTELSTLSDRHAHLENGIYTYPYEPIPCSSPGPVHFQGFGSPLKPVSDVVSMPKVGDSYRLNLDLGQLFASQKPECGGSA